MPLSNYCKKCKRDVPAMDTCTHCGTKLTKTGERLCVEHVHYPVCDWFSWNAMLRIVVPVIGLILLLTLLIEALSNGMAGIQSIFLQGFFWTLMAVFAVLLLITFIALLLQGQETLRYVVHSKGVQISVHLHQPNAIHHYARFLSPQAVSLLTPQEDAPVAAQDEVTVRQHEVLWADVKRVTFWPETYTILLYKPAWWQVMCIRTTAQQYEEIQAYVCKRLARNKNVQKTLPKAKKT